MQIKVIKMSVPIMTMFMWYSIRKSISQFITIKDSTRTLILEVHTKINLKSALFVFTAENKFYTRTEKIRTVYAMGKSQVNDLKDSSHTVRMSAHPKLLSFTVNTIQKVSKL
jgi:hypothetical protein